MTCDDCLHICACEWAHIPPDPEKCEDFKNRARFLELPCAVGDPVYIVGGKYRRGQNEWWINPGKFRLSDLDKIGKTVFLTREEAETALKKRTANGFPQM